MVCQHECAPKHFTGAPDEFYPLHSFSPLRIPIYTFLVFPNSSIENARGDAQFQHCRRRMQQTSAVTATQCIKIIPVSKTYSGDSSSDSTYIMKEVTVTSYKVMDGIGQMKDYAGGVIYAGMKNEVLDIDSLDANKAVNNTRQILGRIPGVDITENEMGGFTANGIGFRGFNPYQSIETNTRQNGYNISADLYGYNEAYYLPPMEAVKSITILEDGSALAFGPQLGGVVNYELKDGGPNSIQVNSSQTARELWTLQQFQFHWRQ